MATITQLIADLETALDYEEGSGDATKAQQVVTLCKKLLLRRPESAGHGGSSVSYAPDQLRELLNDARIFLNSRRNSGGVVFLGVDPRR